MQQMITYGVAHNCIILDGDGFIVNKLVSSMSCNSCKRNIFWALQKANNYHNAQGVFLQQFVNNRSLISCCIVLLEESSFSKKLYKCKKIKMIWEKVYVSQVNLSKHETKAFIILFFPKRRAPKHAMRSLRYWCNLLSTWHYPGGKCSTRSEAKRLGKLWPNLFTSESCG